MDSPLYSPTLSDILLERPKVRLADVLKRPATEKDPELETPAGPSYSMQTKRLELDDDGVVEISSEEGEAEDDYTADSTYIKAWPAYSTRLISLVHKLCYEDITSATLLPPLQVEHAKAILNHLCIRNNRLNRMILHEKLRNRIANTRYRRKNTK